MKKVCDCRECEHFNCETNYCKKLNYTIENKNLNDTYCGEFVKKECELQANDCVMITKPEDTGLHAGILWHKAMDVYDYIIARVVEKQGVGYILENATSTIPITRDTGSYWFFHRSWLTLVSDPLDWENLADPISALSSENLKCPEQDPQKLYRLILVNSGEEPYVGGEAITLEALIVLLNEENVQCDLDAILFEINDCGPDILLESHNWPINLIDEPRWEKK